MGADADDQFAFDEEETGKDVVDSGAECTADITQQSLPSSKICLESLLLYIFIITSKQQKHA